MKGREKMATKKETFKINGEQLLAKVKELIKEGNVRCRFGIRMRNCC